MRIVPLIKETLAEWWNDDVPMLAAAISFYTVFSFAPALMIGVAVASIFYGREAARDEVVNLLRILIGGASPIFETVLEQARPRSGLATTLGIAASLFGATAVFVALQDALKRGLGSYREARVQGQSVFPKAALVVCFGAGRGVAATELSNG